MIAGGGDSEVNRGSSFIRNRPHNEHDTSSADTDSLPNTDQTDLITNTNSSGETHLSIARFSDQSMTHTQSMAHNQSMVCVPDRISK